MMSIPNWNSTVHITLRMANCGSRVNVDPTGGGTYATVDFQADDIIYVGNGGKYVGFLTYNGTGTWSGDITSPTTEDYLHLYFLGNKAPLSAVTPGSTTEFSVSIADQVNEYPVISYNHTKEYYNGAGEYTTTTLYNKCAIGKFTISGVDTDKVITITGMKNTVTVDFSKNGTGDVVNPYTYSKTGSGEIRLHAESNTERWAILLPQDEVTTATAYAAGYITTANFTVPAVSANGYYDSGVAVAMASGSPKGAFTINASGDQVYFSQGNLQYQASTGTWRFAEHQYDFIGGGNFLSESNTDWIDLYRWGTSGINYTGHAELYRPWEWAYYSQYFNPYGSLTTNLYDGAGENAGKADWGYNAISNGGNTQNSGWRTLKNNTTDNEWQYIFNSRTTANEINSTSNARYTQARINIDNWAVKGIILFPDGSIGDTPSGVTWGTINAAASSWSTGTTQCTTAGWAALEAAGCVFLPAAGKYDDSGVSQAEIEGYYWSSSYASDDNAYGMYFKSNEVNPQYSDARHYGLSVRLVKDAN